MPPLFTQWKYVLTAVAVMNAVVVMLAIPAALPVAVSAVVVAVWSGPLTKCGLAARAGCAPRASANVAAANVISASS